jgi:hypothetical protein
MPQGQFPTILAGQDITALLLQLLALPTAWKAADTPRSNSATLAADSDLLVSMAANGNYFFAGVLFATGATIGTGDLSVAFTWPAGAAGAWSGWGFAQQTGTATASANAARSASGAAINFGIGTTLTPVLLAGSVQNGATAGSLQLEWAQSISNSTATTLKARSALFAIRTQ